MSIVTHDKGVVQRSKLRQDLIDDLIESEVLVDVILDFRLQWVCGIGRVAYRGLIICGDYDSCY